MTFTWKVTGYRKSVLHNDAGRILGRVFGSTHEWTAMTEETGPLGRYISERMAKRAVEEAVSAFYHVPVQTVWAGPTSPPDDIRGVRLNTCIVDDSNEYVPPPPVGKLRCAECGERFDTMHDLHEHRELHAQR